MKILIKNVKMLRMVSEDEGILFGNIGIEGENISFIGEIPVSFTADKIINGENLLAIPSFVNAHTHAAMSVLRNYGNDLALMDWLTTKIFPAEEKLDGEWSYWGTLLSIIEMIKSGCTAYLDMYMFVEDAARAVKESGVRANLTRGVAGSGEDEDSKNKLIETEILIKEFNNTAEGRIKIDTAPHAPYTCGDKMFEELIEIANKYDVGVHVHMHETYGEIQGSLKEYRCRPIERLDKLGLFDCKRVMAAHCVHMTDEEVSLFAKKSIHVMHNPSSNLKLASGFAKVDQMLTAGINVSIGTDGSSSNNNVNMTEELHIAAILAKSVAGDAKAVPAYEAIKMATLNGAKTLGIEHLIGSIEVGKKADITLIDTEKPNWYPHTDLISAIPYSMNSSDVRTVLCNGKILMEDYKLTTINENEVMQKVKEIAQKVVI